MVNRTVLYSSCSVLNMLIKGLMLTFNIELTDITKMHQKTFQKPDL